jgi:putative Mg2+ transporter-C (MgtC) family protein
VLLDRAHHQALDAPIPGNGGPAEQEGGKMLAMFGMPGQSLLQLEELTLAFVLSALVGLEREFRQKSAGLRTYTLVGVSAALFMLISKYGFMDVLAANRIVLDPSRVAAQIVSGIGFIGGGVIFMRRDVVRGLTTAASVWLTAALGMACGAGLPLLALATVVGHFVIMFIFPKLAVYIPRQRRTATRLRIAYTQRRGLLQAILVACTQLRFAIDQVEVEHAGSVGQENGEEAQDRADWEGNEEIQQSDDVAVLMVVVKGKRPIWVGRPIHTKTYAKEGS